MPDSKTIKNHPEFDKYSVKYKVWSNLISGAEDMEGNLSASSYGFKYGNNALAPLAGPGISNYLIQAAHEPDNQFFIRRLLATYHNYALPVVSVFSSSIWRKAPIRELPECLMPFVDDVDRIGTSANIFFHALTQLTATYGIMHVMVDLPVIEGPVNPNGAPRTKKQDRLEGIRPYLTAILPLDIPRWGTTKDGIDLEYAVVDSTEPIDSGPFEEINSLQKYKILYRDHWEEYEDALDGKGLVGVRSEPYEINKVPLVQSYFKKRSRMTGDSAIAEVASICIHAYRMNSSLDKSLYDTACPLLFVSGMDPDDVKEFTRSSHNGLIGPEGSNAKYVEPSGKAFSDLRQSIEKDVADIQEITLRMVRPSSRASSSASSAKSKSQDRLQLDSQLAVFSRSMESVEVRSWELMLDWMGKPELKKDINIRYNRDFDLEKISKELLSAFLQMNVNAQLSRKTMLGLLKRGEVLPEDMDIEAEEELIKEEIEDQLNTSTGLRKAFPLRHREGPMNEYTPEEKREYGYEKPTKEDPEDKQ